VQIRMVDDRLGSIAIDDHGHMAMALYDHIYHDRRYYTR